MLTFSATYQKCVHTEHCCIYHGCKYGDDNCPVWLGYKPQSYPYWDGMGSGVMSIEEAQGQVSHETIIARRDQLVSLLDDVEFDTIYPIGEKHMNELHRLILKSVNLANNAGETLSYDAYTRVKTYLDNTTTKQHAFGDSEQDALEHMYDFIRDAMWIYFNTYGLKDVHIWFEAYYSVLGTGHCYPDDGKLKTYLMADICKHS